MVNFEEMKPVIKSGDHPDTVWITQEPVAIPIPPEDLR
jgi:hypothetical protein